METKTTDTQLSVVSRIARDISDGIILIDKNGIVRYVNPSATKLLGSDALKAGNTYAKYMASDANSANDAFHQYVLDSIYEKDVPHTGAVTYTRQDGSIRYFDIDTSWLFSENGMQEYGVILQFSDVTDLHIAREKHNDTIKVLVGLFAILAVWNYVYMIWKQAGEPIPSTALTLIIEVVGVIGTAFALRFTSITWEDFGLGVKGLKKALVFDSILTVLVLAALILAKLLGRVFFPGVISPDKPFALWSMFSVLDLLYLPTVVIQEFLTRGVVQGSLDRILPDYYPAAVSIVVSSLFFGALHLHKGLLYMLGAAFLLSFFGILYRKQRSIWGLCIPHLVLSWSFKILFGWG